MPALICRSALPAAALRRTPALNIYNTFGDKPAIFDRVLTRYNEQTGHHFDALKTNSNGLAALEAFVDQRQAQVLTPASGRGCLIATTMCELGGRQPDTRQHCQHHRVSQQQALAAAIDQGGAQGDLIPGDTETRAALLLAANIGSAATDDRPTRPRKSWSWSKGCANSFAPGRHRPPQGCGAPHKPASP